MNESNVPLAQHALQLPVFGLMLPDGIGPFLLQLDDYQLGAVPLFSDPLRMVEFLSISDVGSSRKIYAICSKSELRSYLFDSVGEKGWAILNPALNPYGELVGRYTSVSDVMSNAIEMPDMLTGSSHS